MFNVGGGSHPRKEASRYRRAISRWGCPNNQSQMVTAAPLMAVHAQATAPLSDFEAWWSAYPHDCRAPTRMDARKLRRAVIAIRNGCTCAEAAKAIGLTGGRLKIWLDRLPPELRP